MTRQPMPLDAAIGSLDLWASTIAEHAAMDRNLVRVQHDVRQALGNMDTLAKMPMELVQARDFRRASLELLSVIQPFVGSADRVAFDRLRSFITTPRPRS